VNETRVLVVEDSDVYRETLVLLLDAADGICVAGAVPDVGAALGTLDDRLDAGVVLLDLRLPGVSGGAAVAALRAAAPSLRVICLTGQRTSELDAEALAAGAELVLEKGVSTHDLADAIRSAP
jgi:DNA-binding NarL/FixJ family response regulator